MLKFAAEIVDRAIVVPTTGQTVVVPNNVPYLIVNPAGTLAALTVQMPAALSNPVNSAQPFDIIFMRAITNLTWTVGAGATLGGVARPATIILGGRVNFVWVQSLAQWVHSTYA